DCAIVAPVATISRLQAAATSLINLPGRMRRSIRVVGRLQGGGIDGYPYTLFEHQELAIVLNPHGVRCDMRAGADDVDGLVRLHSAFSHVEGSRFQLCHHAVGGGHSDVSAEPDGVLVAVV